MVGSSGRNLLGNQKTFAVSQLLRCVNTNQLVSLEIVANLGDQRMGDTTTLFAECLTDLHRSFNSLLHLRLSRLSFREDRPDSRYFFNFRNMRMLTLEGSILQGLQICGEEMVIPSSLEVVWLPCYSDPEFQIEEHLFQLIKLRSSPLPRLREVAVPKSPVLQDRAVGKLQNWTVWRERLEREEIFTSGKVTLRKAEEGERGE